MSLLTLFQWAAKAPVFAVLRDSKWGFATVEMVHLLALALFGGALLVIDLGALGIGLRQPATWMRTARALTPLVSGSVVVMAISGLLLVSAEALKCYYHPAFRIKMALFAVALTFHVTVHRRAMQPADGTLTAGAKVAAVVSLSLWLGVGLAGRAIGFF